MALTNDLIQQFVKATKDDSAKTSETVVYGTIVKSDNKTYVQLDGSTLYTPVSSTIVVKHGDRVMVTSKDHSLVVTGNLTDPSASSGEVDDVKENVNTRIDEFDIILADKVSTDVLNAKEANIIDLIAGKASIQELEAVNGKIENLEADNVTINDTLNAHAGKFDSIDTTFINISGELQANSAKIGTLEATEADFRTLESDYADFKNATIDELEATNASVKNLDAEFVTVSGELQAQSAKIDNLDTTYARIDVLDAVAANIHILESDYADFKNVTADNLEATNATIKNLNSSYANIDFSNIGEAAVEKLFSESGLIKDLIMSDGTVTGELVGVTIKGDLIEANTLKADKLVVKGKDGLYYKLNIDGGALTSEDVTEEELQNGLSGSIIIAKSITAEKVAVDDLVAFNATIGGFNISTNAIYSGVKSSVDNTTKGIYLDNDGQIAFGDDSNYIKYYKDIDGTYKLAISARSISLSSSNKTIEEIAAEAEAASKTVEDLEKRIEDGNFKGEDAVVLRIDSSRGTVFKNSSVSTVLSVTIYKGSNCITNIESLHAVFGPTAYLEWQWQRMGEETFGTIVSTDSRIGNGGFTFTLSPADVDTKVVFMCQLITD